jgi:hypothetical protein
VVWGGRFALGSWSENFARGLLGYRMAVVAWSRRESSGGRLRSGVITTPFLWAFRRFLGAGGLDGSDCGRGAGGAEIFGGADF